MYLRERRSTVSCVVSSKTVVTTLRSSLSFEKSNSLRIVGMSCIVVSLKKAPLREAAVALYFFRELREPWMALLARSSSSTSASVGFVVSRPRLVTYPAVAGIAPAPTPAPNRAASTARRLVSAEKSGSELMSGGARLRGCCVAAHIISLAPTLPCSAKPCAEARREVVTESIGVEMPCSRVGDRSLDEKVSHGWRTVHIGRPCAMYKKGRAHPRCVADLAPIAMVVKATRPQCIENADLMRPLSWGSSGAQSEIEYARFTAPGPQTLCSAVGDWCTVDPAPEW